MNMMSLPYWASSRLLPERKPSPKPTSKSKDPTPHAMPNMVRNERNLCAQRVRKIWAKMSTTMRMTVLIITHLWTNLFPLDELRPLQTGFSDGLDQSPETELQKLPKMVTSRYY